MGDSQTVRARQMILAGRVYPFENNHDDQLPMRKQSGGHDEKENAGS
jgi:hypothetical protein